jgi:signal transduction histidine kinase
MTSARAPAEDPGSSGRIRAARRLERTARPRPLAEAERAPAVLSLGILALRWVTLALMTLMAVITGDLRRPFLAGVAIAVTTAWTVWLTVARPRGTAPVLAADLALAVGLTLVSGLVVAQGQVVGSHPFFASAYPVAAAVFWGATAGFRAGLASGAVIGVSLVVTHFVNGIDVLDETTPQLLSLASGALNFVLAGGAVGLVAQLLDRSAAELRRAAEETMRARERAARLSERESLARQIHDSVLQSLAMVHKRGRELAGAGAVPAEEVARLAEMAASQERALRTLILRVPGEAPSGTASLRASLEELAQAELPVSLTVSATGPIWLPIHHVEELTAGVRQALDNVVEHAAASRVVLFAEEDAGTVVLAVRDDGAGFSYDEARLAADGKMGIVKSIKGRVEQLGGSMRVESAPGAGTEVELRVPARPEARQDDP